MQSKPQFFDDSDSRIPCFPIKKRAVWPSMMFAIKLELQEFVNNNPKAQVFDASQGDGGLSLNGIPRDELCKSLGEYLPAERTTMYGTANEAEKVRRAIYENYYSFDEKLGLTHDNIILGDGGGRQPSKMVSGSSISQRKIWSCNACICCSMGMLPT